MIGVDPGDTVGIAHYRRDTEMIVALQLPEHRAVAYLWGLIDTTPDLVLAVERYDIGQETITKTRQYSAIKVTGAIEYRCYGVGAGFHLYGRSDCKNFGTDRKLNTMGVVSKKLVHGRDAARVLLTHLAATDDLPERLFNMDF